MSDIKSVLLVDDMEIEHVNMQYVLEDYDDSIVLHSVYDGQEALTFLATVDVMPDVIFLDINMPRMNGHEFLEAYQCGESRVPVVVMLTSSDQESDKKKCEAHPIVKRYVPKPIDEEQLEEIETLLL